MAEQVQYKFLDIVGVGVLKEEFDKVVVNSEESAKEYADGIKNDLLNGAGDAYDTLKELGELIDDNTDALSVLEGVATGKADAIHAHDDLYYTEQEVDTKILALTNYVDEQTQELMDYVQNKAFVWGVF